MHTLQKMEVQIHRKKGEFTVTFNVDGKTQEVKVVEGKNWRQTS